uniref:Large ribosomal subunit protein bL12c n=1 Tax=Euglenaformis proxima TaxID=299110 RepID=A0A023HHY1_9EUGL|nr:ribosomal protein L12 [Euglenaformis proxima]AGL12023.1 ribosomal protein L12 [Euglenaformis proxima]
MSTKIDQVIDILKTISLVEASDLIKRIEETFNIDVSMPSNIMMDSAKQIGSKVDEQLVEEKTSFDVSIESVPTTKRITVIKVVRSLTSLGLKEAKDIIESVPKIILEGLSKEKADEAKKLLEDAGAIVAIK